MIKILVQLIKKKTLLLFVCLTLTLGTNGQEILVTPLPRSGHPRLLTDAGNGQLKLVQLLKKQPWARQTFETINSAVTPFVNQHQTDSTWIVSRLQLYWKSKYSDIYINNGAYVRGSGSTPIPTVRFSGTRDATTQFIRPKIEDIKPYMDNDGKIYLPSKSAANQWEWVDQSKSGRII